MAPSNISMAVPAIQNAIQCTDYSSTVEPYLYQLRPLFEAVFEHITSLTALKQLYIDTNPFVTGLACSLFLSPFFLAAAEINRNYSQVDRFWSIIPTLYNLHWALWTHLSGLSTTRMDLRLFVSLVWSTRLTYNYWRRGGYQIGSEDYRWLIIKDYIGSAAFFILDVFFISSMQNVLLFLVTAPSYISVLLSRLETASNPPAVQSLDYVFTAFGLGLIALTYASDQQQWNYQTAKYSYRDTGKVPQDCGFTKEQFDLGFRTTGLWAYSRHPNFLFEQTLWWTFYLWSSITAGTLFNWTIVGPLIYSSVFWASTPLTEWISGNKYPEYREYKKQVGMFVPLSLSPPTFTGRSVNKQKQISNGSPAAKKNAEDYAQAKKRYDLR